MIKERLKKYTASVLPGIFLIGYNIGTGSITSMSKAGANFGLDLIWTVALSCLFTYFLMIHFAKFTAVTKKTAIQGIKAYLSPVVSKILIAALSLIIITALIGVLGIITDIMHAWTSETLSFGISRNYFAIAVSLILLYLLWKGSTRTFERILSILVSIMGIAFIGIMIMYFPEPAELLKGFVPKLPKVTEGSDNNQLVILTGMVGTTVSTFVFIIRTQQAKEKNWDIHNFNIQKRDARVSAILMFIISAAVIITAASTLYTRNIKLNHVVEMVGLLTPIAGKNAITLMVIGIVAAGISSHLPNLLVIPWLLMDYKEEKGRDIRQRKYRIILLVLSVICTLGVMFNVKPVFIMLLSQAALSFLLPFVVGVFFFLTAKRSVMKEFTNTVKETLMLSLISAFALFMGTQSFIGVINDIKNMVG